MGIDWGRGQTNIDLSSGIRYGVIPAHDVGAGWYDASEGYYGPATCPLCGNEAAEYDQAEEEYGDENTTFDEAEGDIVGELSPASRGSCADFGCVRCGVYFGSDEAYGDDSISHRYGIGDDGEAEEGADVVATQGGDDCDIFIFRSEFFTFAPFCSPCAPGACYLRDGDYSGDDRAYCFGHDWFWDTERGFAPYPVFRASDGAEVYPPGLSF